MEIPKQEYRSELPFPSPRDLPNTGIDPISLAMASGFFIPLSHLGSSLYYLSRDQFLKTSFFGLVFNWFTFSSKFHPCVLCISCLQHICKILLIPPDHQQFIWCWGKMEKQVHSLPGRTGAELGAWRQRQGQVEHSPHFIFLKLEEGTFCNHS